ncbi:MAG TPA: hypothetical protein VGD45_06790 [Steroidobacter sp.]|uniref:hypothetical protein n=1 Tax=Steroidobacter sp. TaxID=1978227 RepID=UPI002EDAB101
MSTTVVLPELAFTPQSSQNPVSRAPSSPDSVARFEQLMFAPNNATSANSATLNAVNGVGNNRLQLHLERLSERWEASQAALNRFADRKDVTTKDLVVTQMQMINCALDVEVSSKCASIFENGVQTLTQRA